VIYQPRLPILLTVIAFATGAGGWIVVMYGAFQNIGAEVMEAAKIDGCNAIQTALYIKLPLITKYIVYMLILSFAGGIQLFVEPQLLARAAGNTISHTWSPNELAYEFAFNLGNFGVSAAISTILLIIGLIGAFLLIFKTKFFSSDVR
jgi:multiple sugar transport system permease protein